ncbi:glycosyltransferase [Actinomycetospora callitridis]|nr:glycosyltransferase [Actinomycetospora callitridis]MDD7917652.1 glycosyltransferase [Actinomycetospora callitridis]
MRFGYVCGALRVSTHPDSTSIGPRAHVVGFLDGLRHAGIKPRTYLAGEDPKFGSPSVKSQSLRSRSLARRATQDLARIALGALFRRRARNALGSVDVLYERQASFQNLGAPFRRKGAFWIIESNGPFWYEASEERKSLALTRLARRSEIKAYRDADLVVVVSEALKRIIVDATGRDADDVFVIPNGTDPSRFDPSVASADRRAPAPTIGFVGYVTEWAGLDTLIRALPDIRETVPLSATIVGEGPALASLRKLAAECGVGDAVHFTGHVAWDRVPSLLAGFDLAYSGQQKMKIGEMYHSPQKLYEYQSMGIPLVASRYPDAEKLVANGVGALFTPGDEQSLKTAIEDALQLIEDRGARAHARQQVIVRHSWQARVTSLLSELQRRGAIGEHNGRAQRARNAW